MKNGTSFERNYIPDENKPRPPLGYLDPPNESLMSYVILKVAFWIAVLAGWIAFVFAITRGWA